MKKLLYVALSFGVLGCPSVKNCPLPKCELGQYARFTGKAVGGVSGSGTAGPVPVAGVTVQGSEDCAFQCLPLLEQKDCPAGTTLLVNVREGVMSCVQIVPGVPSSTGGTAPLPCIPQE
jgi:hypothetical protein